MKSTVRCYLGILLAVILGWLWLHKSSLADFVASERVAEFVGVMSLYLCSHIVRIFRLTLLTLDERDKVFPLMAAHTLTAFPSSFLPFKIGEVLRLTAFFQVYGGRRKAFAVWLAERFGDVLVIAAFILGLYVFNISIPPAMRIVFILFVLASVFGLLAIFAVAKVSVYLNRHLVLASHSARGLWLLRTSHSLRLLEQDIHRSLEGRLSGFLLLSLLVWALEILALALFINEFSIGEPNFATLFVSGLLSSLPGGGVGNTEAFGIYQSLALVALTLIFLGAVCFSVRFKLQRS
ncbi:flippase-like domain-containing protein [Pseudomonas sp. ZM23]|uniref:Lysylphosphatidylglycerol synthase domain-containing protein n=1 Tax=Pseudomonas triclosanedens TaxID=2961893 RepID=A0ABY7A4Q8_9PSED|nr:lysylphosphatidylglycerol synthase domain-containing protein [Pseudomonas triclosanedens]MCP8464218.1 flippase-like domain-containing protein [Pseudomonas triclosanedens]MCP8471352.1 flippase-like domain-containing protein [Pseudomonas triclosanedens]MCP8477839.1 flippase-like domain-containing protein [Pseudomonas triclosanedens]WAI51285.1 lysylphosphatidylglycerol synthase domain-containing protein [Pseudomonas triclosanedens]